MNNEDFKNFYVALDQDNKIVSLNKELFLVQQESKSFDHFKKEYGVRIYKIYNEKQEILSSL